MNKIIEEVFRTMYKNIRGSGIWAYKKPWLQCEEDTFIGYINGLLNLAKQQENIRIQLISSLEKNNLYTDEVQVALFPYFFGTK